jgi:uncharacterized protein YbbK (DUF523 family)
LKKRIKMKVLISACVVGSPVRWNTSARHHEFVTTWAKENGIELVPVCPEARLLGIPRRPIRMIQVGEVIEAWCGKEEVYDSLEETSRKAFDEHSDVCGFIGLANSPTCGMAAGVKKRGATIRGAMHRVAEVPTCEVNQLKNETGRKSFLNRIRRYRSSQI